MGAEDHRAARDDHGDPAALADRLFRNMTGARELLTVYLGERPATLRRYAREAGFQGLEVLPVAAGTLRFYRLTP